MSYPQQPSWQPQQPSYGSGQQPSYGSGQQPSYGSGRPPAHQSGFSGPAQSFGGGQTWGGQWGQPSAQPYGQQQAPRPGQYGQQQYGQQQHSQHQHSQHQYQQPQGGHPQQGAYWQQQPGGHRPGTGHPAPGPGQPRGKRNPLATALIVVAGLVVAGIAVLVVIGLATGGPGVKYANEDWVAPEVDTNPDQVPAPSSIGEAEQWTADSAIYGQQFPSPIKCELTPLDQQTATDAELEQQLNDLVGCIMGGWDQPMTAIGVTMPRPSVTVYDETGVQTPCGFQDEPNAMYCGVNQQLYYASHLNEYVGAIKSSRFGHELVIAHEFGHYIQGRLGITTSRMALMEMAGSEQEALRINRRLEAQADCFSALFLKSSSVALGIKQSDVDDLNSIMNELGGPDPGKTHPSGPSRVYWGSVGLSTDDIGKCNTFTAPDDTVI